MLFEDGSAVLENSHMNDFHHLMDLQIHTRMLIRNVVLEELERNNEITTNEMILIISSKFKIDYTFPGKKYISNIISNFRQNLIGKPPKKLEEVSMDSLEKNFRISA